MTPSKRAMARQATESPPSNTKKRKQSLMDDYVNSVMAFALIIFTLLFVSQNEECVFLTFILVVVLQSNLRCQFQPTTTMPNPATDGYGEVLCRQSFLYLRVLAKLIVRERE